MSNTIITPERPKRYDPLIVEEVHKYIAGIIREWNNEFDEEESLEHAQRIKWNHFHDNGFELARELEVLRPDAQLVDELDMVSYAQSSIMDKYVKAWVKENNIVCPLKIGDVVIINDGYFRGTEAEIKRVYEEVARYGIWHEKMKCPKEDNMVQVYDIEQVTPK